MDSRDHLKSSLSLLLYSPSGWDFFVGIKDYVQYILENPDLRAHVENLKKERESLLEEERVAELETKKELLISLDKIREIITKNNLESIPEITRILTNIESYQTNRLQMSGKFSDNLDHFLFEICRNTPEDKRFILFKNFIDENKEQKNIYGNFSFSSTLEDRRKLTKHIEHRDKIEIWSDWLRLEKVPLFMEADSIYKVELKNGDNKHAYELIEARCEYDQNGSTSKFTKIIPEYKKSVLKVHTFLVRRIGQTVSRSQEKYHELSSTEHKESVKTIVKAAKLKCLDTVDGSVHRELHDYWLNTRRVLDVICNKLYGGLGGDTKKEVPVSLREFFANRVSERKQGVIFETLDHLVQRGVISSKVPSGDDTYIVRNGVFYNDNALLVIQDVLFLKDLRQKVSSLALFIEEDGKKRFPLKYIPQSEKIQQQTKATIAHSDTSFDQDSSTLFFQNKKIIVSKSKNSHPHYLLQTIFKDSNKVWSFDEIAEDWGREYGKNDWRTYYNASYSTNKKIATKTQIEDFLAYTKTTVCIKEDWR